MLMRLIMLLRDIGIGTLLCLNPVSSIIFLGWLSRRMDNHTQVHWGHSNTLAHWLRDKNGQNVVLRWFGGLFRNIIAGLKTLVGLAIWTLPFGLTWLGAWWAGWDNSFNKGYEQALIGPAIWLAGGLVALVSLSHLPFALAHGASEGRVGAFLDIRKIRSVRAAAGWRAAWIALTTVFFALPFLGARALPVFVEDIVPAFSEMTIDQQVNIGYLIAFFTAGYTVVSLMILRHQAAKMYAIAVPIAAAGRDAALWAETTLGQNAKPRKFFTRSRSGVWLIICCFIWAALVAQILIGQFMNYEPYLWLTHPFFLLPWFG